MAAEVGSVIEGKVSGITKFGVFVDIGEGVTGMVHISEVARNYVKDIKEYVRMGQEVKVKVITVSPEGKVSLSIKQAEAPAQRDSRPRQREQQRCCTGGGTDSFEFKPCRQAKMSFEDMMSNFKKSSDEKMSDLKKVIDAQKGRPRRPKQQ